jgi:cytosine/adenosine deaminase-related metal-dependent hydrolase
MKEDLAFGWVNAHTHMYSALTPLGMPAPDPAPVGLSEILRRVWWRLDRALDEPILRAAARLYVGESLMSGTTTIIDHHESPDFIEGSLDVLADACQDLGLRALLCYGATERNGGLDEARRGLAECRRFLETNERPLVRGAVGLHASFTVSDETVEEAGALAREFGTVVHMHMAEGEEDQADAHSRGFLSSLSRLLQLDGLPEGSILAHGVHLSHADVRVAEERGLWIVQNPRSNRANGVGYPLALGESRRVALGTDGYPSEVIPEGEALLLDAVAHGEDLVVAKARVRAGEELAHERFEAAPQPLVTTGNISVGERLVVREGNLICGNMVELIAEAQAQAARLWERMGAIQ